MTQLGEHPWGFWLEDTDNLHLHTHTPKNKQASNQDHMLFGLWAYFCSVQELGAVGSTVLLALGPPSVAH